MPLRILKYTVVPWLMNTLTYERFELRTAPGAEYCFELWTVLWLMNEKKPFLPFFWPKVLLVPLEIICLLCLVISLQNLSMQFFRNLILDTPLDKNGPGICFCPLFSTVKIFLSENLLNSFNVCLFIYHPPDFKGHSGQFTANHTEQTIINNIIRQQEIISKCTSVNIFKKSKTLWLKIWNNRTFNKSIQGGRE